MTTEREEEQPRSERRPLVGEGAQGADHVAAPGDLVEATPAAKPRRAATKKKGRNPKYREPDDPAPGWVKRLKEAIDRSGLSLREISRRVALETDGLRVGEGLIAQWISGRSRRPEFQKVLATFLVLPDANAWWIMTGVGEIDAPNPRPLPEALAQFFESDKKLSATVRRAIIVFLAKHWQDLVVEDLESVAREFVAGEARAKKVVEAALRAHAMTKLEGDLEKRREESLQRAVSPRAGRTAKEPR